MWCPSSRSEKQQRHSLTSQPHCLQNPRGTWPWPCHCFLCVRTTGGERWRKGHRAGFELRLVWLCCFLTGRPCCASMAPCLCRLGPCSSGAGGSRCGHGRWALVWVWQMDAGVGVVDGLLSEGKRRREQRGGQWHFPIPLQLIWNVLTTFLRVLAAPHC